MGLKRAAPALAWIALVVACISGVFLLASNASAHTAAPVAAPPAVSAVGNDQDGADLVVTGMATIAAGVVLVSVWWVWQALNRGPAQVRSRSRLDRKPRHRHE